MPAKRHIPTVLPVPCDVLRPLAARRHTADRGRSECDVLLARLATRQSGVVGRAQLIALGFTRNEIAGHVESGRLIRIHQSVYAVGHVALGDRGRMVAALLAGGPNAVLSHRTAGYLWRLLRSMPQLVDITITQGRRRRRQGLRIHSAAALETTTHEGLPVTTPHQTLAQLSPPDRDRATSEALFLGLIERDHTRAAAEPTRSHLEGVLLRAIEAAGLQAPHVQHRIGRHRVDFCWPGRMLVVETDGWQGHGHRIAFERDRARDAELQALGYAVLRFTWRQVLHETVLVVVRIAQLLARTPHRALGTPLTGG